MSRWLLVITVGLTSLGSGCLIPIPLEQQVTTDGGRYLQVKAAIPPFGTQRATSILEKYSYQVDVVTDSPDVAARLYVQLNGTCCDLNLDNPNITRYFQQAQVAVVDPAAGSYSPPVYRDCRSDTAPERKPVAAGRLLPALPLTLPGGSA